MATPLWCLHAPVIPTTADGDIDWESRGSRRISITTSCVSLVPLFFPLLPSFLLPSLAAHQQPPLLVLPPLPPSLSIHLPLPPPRRLLPRRSARGLAARLGCSEERGGVTCWGGGGWGENRIKKIIFFIKTRRCGFRCRSPRGEDLKSSRLITSQRTFLFRRPEMFRGKLEIPKCLQEA